MTTQKTTKPSRILSALVSGVIRFLSLLPLSVAQGLGGLIGGAARWLAPKMRATTRLNIQFCFPELSDAERRDLLRRSFVESGKTAAEFGAMWFWKRERLEALEGGVEGAEILEEALAENRGVVLLVPHLGNWEIFNHYLTARYPLTALYRPPRYAELDGALRRIRERSGVEMIRTDHAGMRRALTALHSGRILFMMPDQEPLKRSGVFAPLFHIPALTMTLASKLVAKTGAVPVFGFAERRRGGKFYFRFFPSPAGVGDPDPLHSATALNAGLETCIRARPEQYQWGYRRFRSRPPGEPMPYRPELRDSPEGGKLYLRYWSEDSPDKAE